MTPPSLVFGWRSALLGLSILQLLAIAIPLSRTIANRDANRSLAALLFVLAGMLTPFAIGFAGFYDRWPRLTFAPFSVPLAVGPLVWFYAHALTIGRLPPHRSLHLAPAILHFAYQAASFLLPYPAKLRWDALSTPIVDPIVAIGAVASIAGYGIASLALLRAYRRFLAARHSDDHRYAVRWLSRALAAVAVLLAVRVGYQIVDLFHPLDYFGVQGLYDAIALFGLYVGIEGWRHADRHFPPIIPEAPPSAPAPGQDWAALGRKWATTTREGGWHADPELSLAGLARRLGTNTTYLSRALNEGLGINFSTFVNRLRAEQVATAIAADDARNVLDIALDAGFSSKASFNRAFAASTGLTPTEYRRRHGSKAINP